MQTTYKNTITISKKELDIINKHLSGEIIQGEDNTITYTAIYPNGVEMDIKCCGCQEEPSWVESVLFCGRHEVACSECEDDILGLWTMEYKGNIYECEVIIKEEIKIMTNVYVLTNKYATEDTTGVDVQIFKNLDKAREEMAKQINFEKTECWDYAFDADGSLRSGYVMEEDTDYFEIWEEGYYNSAHTLITIGKKQVIE